MHIDAGQVDAIRIKRAHGHDFFNLGHADLAGRGGGWVEIARGFAEHQIARRIGLPCLDDRQIGHNAGFQNMGLAFEILVVFSIGNHCAYACAGVKPCNPCAACAQPFGQRALGVKLQLQLTRQILAHEFGVFAHIGRDHFLDLAGVQQLPKTKPINPCVVGRNRKVFCSRIPNGRDQQFGDAAQTKATRRNQHAVEQHTIKRCSGRRIDFFHAWPR